MFSGHTAVRPCTQKKQLYWSLLHVIMARLYTSVACLDTYCIPRLRVLFTFFIFLNEERYRLAVLAMAMVARAGWKAALRISTRLSISYTLAMSSPISISEMSRRCFNFDIHMPGNERASARYQQLFWIRFSAARK